MDWWLWLVVGLGLLVVEMVTPGGLFALFFGAGALVISLLTGLGVGGPPWLQWSLFSVISLALLLVFRRRLKTHFAGETKVVDSLVGEAALALEDIPSGGSGRVELRGAPWKARNEGYEPVAKGKRCRVERVEGLTLWIRPE